MRNPFDSELCRNPAFARVWTAATISIFLAEAAAAVVEIERDQPVSG